MNSNVKLERKLNPINVWALALGCIIGWGAFVMPGTTFLPKAGVTGTAIGMAVAAVVMIIIGMNYGYMVQKYPVAGGEYTFTKRTFGRRAAFVCGWFLSLSYLCIVPLNATALGLVSRKLLGGALEFGHLYTIANWDIYVGEILLASAALIIFAVMSIKGVSVAGWMQTVIAMALVASIFVLIVAAFFCPEVKVSNLQPGLPDNTAPMAAIIAVVAIAPWAFVGFDSIPQAAEEFAFSPKKVTVIMAIAIVFGAAVYVAMNTLTAAAMPWQEMMAAGYDWPTGEAIEIIMGKAGLIFLGVAMVCAVLSGIVGFYMATSRLLMSMAREGALPEWFGQLDYRTKTPKNSIIFVMLISLIAPWFGREVLVWVVDMSSVGAAIGYGCTCMATFVTLKRNPQDKKPVLKALSVFGSVLSVIFVLLLIVPGMPSYLPLESRIALIVWCIMGVFFYVISHGRPQEAIYLRRNQRIKRQMKQIEYDEAQGRIDSLRKGNYHFKRRGDKKLTEEQKDEVRKFWSKYEFAYQVNPTMVKTPYNRSGIFDPRYVPYELKDMIRSTMVPERYVALQGKTFLPKQLISARLPQTKVALYDGIFYDGEYNLITEDQAFDILMNDPEELVYKPTKETSGGKGIYFMQQPTREELEEVISKMRGGMIVQSALVQHPKINTFNESTVNTIIITSYKRPTNEVVIVAALMKVGGKGVRVDNYKQGGCVIGIDYETGKFNDWALASDYSRITVLPSGIDLKEKERFVPGYEKLKAMVKETHLDIPQVKLMSWDIAIDEESEPVVIEVNFGGDLRMHQIVTGPVFREYTEEILDEVLIKKYYKETSVGPYDIYEYKDYVFIGGYYGVAYKVKVPAMINGKPVRGIRSEAFKDSEYLREVYLPDTVTAIGKDAFKNCPQLKKFSYKGELRTCGKSIFDKSKQLKEVDILPSVMEKYEKQFKR